MAGMFLVNQVPSQAGWDLAQNQRSKPALPISALLFFAYVVSPTSTKFGTSVLRHDKFCASERISVGQLEPSHFYKWDVIIFAVPLLPTDCVLR